MSEEDTSEMTIDERIKGNTVRLYNYLKHDGAKDTKTKTGQAILTNKVKNMSIIDIDINKSLEEEQRNVIRGEIIEKLSSEDIIVKTQSGGLHVYTNTDDFIPTSNRMIKCFESDVFDIDILSGVDEDKRSLLVMAGSKVRENATKPIGKYEFINGDYGCVITRSVYNVLDDLGIEKIKTKSKEEIEEVIKNPKSKKSDEIYNYYQEQNNISDELATAIVNGLTGLDIHNDAGGRTIDDEITLFVLFQAINSLPEQYIEQAYKNVQEECILTEKAEHNFNYARNRYSRFYTSPYILCKILKIHNEEYYKQYVKPLLRKPINIQCFDYDDDFDYVKFMAKFQGGEYSNDVDIINDLSRFIRFCPTGKAYYIEKVFKTTQSSWGITTVSETDMEKKLKALKLKKGTVFDIFNANKSNFTVRDITFYSEDPLIFSFFHGYKYNILEDYDEEIIKPWLDFVKEVIAADDEKFFEYLLNWLAFIVQRPGQKTETAFILIGENGIGKNKFFSDKVCELLNGYSISNITKITEITGRFNAAIENKMLIVCNELKNADEAKLDDKIYDQLKSLITDVSQRVEQKYSATREAFNVANYIFVSNNPIPIKLEKEDRRYFVQKGSNKYKGNFEFFDELSTIFTKEFYDNLLTFFIKRDIEGFEPRLLPQTEAREKLKVLSRNTVDVWIAEHLNSLKQGMTEEDILFEIPLNIKNKNIFIESIKDKCTKKTIKRNGITRTKYKIKESEQKKYEKKQEEVIEEDNEEEEDN